MKKKKSSLFFMPILVVIAFIVLINLYIVLTPGNRMENPLTPNLDDIIRQVKLLHTKHAFSSVEEEDKSERPTILTVARNFEDARFAGYKILRNKNGVSMVLVYSDSEGKRYIAQVPLDSEGRRSISGNRRTMRGDQRPAYWAVLDAGSRKSGRGTEFTDDYPSSRGRGSEESGGFPHQAKRRVRSRIATAVGFNS